MNYEKMYNELENKIMKLGFDEELTGKVVINFINEVEDSEKERQEAEGEQAERQEEAQKVEEPKVNIADIAKKKRLIK